MNILICSTLMKVSAHKMEISHAQIASDDINILYESTTDEETLEELIFSLPFHTAHNVVHPVQDHSHDINSSAVDSLGMDNLVSNTHQRSS